MISSAWQKWLPVYCVRNRYAGIILINIFYPITLQPTLEEDLKKTTASRAAEEFLLFFFFSSMIYQVVTT